MNVSETMDRLMILNDDCKCMTEKEYEFIDDMEKRRLNGYSFTLPQLKWINAIYEDRMI